MKKTFLMLACISLNISHYALANNEPSALSNPNVAQTQKQHTPDEIISHFGDDALAIAEGENSKDVDKKNLALLMKFVDANGTMSGAAGSCIPSEQVYIEMCVNLTLSHWKEITGFDLNSVKLDNDKSFKDIVKNAFKKQEDNAYAYMSQHPDACSNFIDQERHSPLWLNCNKTGREQNIAPHSDSSDTVNLQ